MSEFWQDFRPYLRTQTRDTSHYGLDYLSGLLRMQRKRTIANVGRQSQVEPQNMHHFVSNSPWSGPGLIAAVQAKVKQRAEFQSGAMLLVDESADEKGGNQSAGASRQHNGRLGKVDWPKTKRGKRAKHPLSKGRASEVRTVALSQHLQWQRITLPPSEQGYLTAEFAQLPVWTVYNQTLRREWLLLRLDENRITCVLSNASPLTSLETMAWRKSHRYFAE